MRPGKHEDQCGPHSHPARWEQQGNSPASPSWEGNQETLTPTGQMFEGPMLGTHFN